ncbi:SDR family NAD(P)-dependent oxidoreductase [Streptomyces sp. NPDC035033]|uniref:SDR family NAD(P)-dependent oxidoreductase n=1 Tax=Streptomyces sp. NPDC035033 TaxID=3155368 RepID=UPI0034087A29
MSKRVLITGGSSGLGRALAERYAATGARVLIADRNRPERLPAGVASFIRIDVRMHEDWQRALRWCENYWGGLDILVNNAGVTAAGRVEQLQSDDWDWILGINLKGVAQGCQTFVPLFKRQGSGHIVNVASSTGLLNPPGTPSDNASKAAVVSLSESIRQELAPFGIHTTVVCPGPIRTDLRAELHSPDPGMAEIVDREIQDTPHTAEQMAGKITDAVGKGRFLVITHPEDRRALCLKRLFPRVADAQAARRWRRTAMKLKAPGSREREEAA